MLSLEKQKQIVQEVLGTPLPEVEPIYLEGAKLYEKTAWNQFITPYLLRELFSPVEMRLVLALPGTAEEVAEKVGMNPIEVGFILDRLYRYGKLLPRKKGQPGYVPSVDVMTIRDHVAGAYLGMRVDWRQDAKMFRLMDAWTKMEDVPQALKDGLGGSFRVIPKYASIKDLPGVMFCENMKEIMESFQEVDKLTIAQCVCKVFHSFTDLGYYDPNYCTSGLHETCENDGHCLAFGNRADYVSQRFGAHYATEEEWQRCLKEIDESTAVLTAPNKRQIDFICTCCDDCCPMAGYEKVGLPIRKPSRFRPAVREERCVGCGLCESRCVFHAVKLVDGKAAIDSTQCMGCGNCVVTCPSKALKMQIVHDVDWVPDLWEEDNNWNIPEENDRNYLKNQKKQTGKE